MMKMPEILGFVGDSTDKTAINSKTQGFKAKYKNTYVPKNVPLNKSFIHSVLKSEHSLPQISNEYAQVCKASKRYRNQKERKAKR